MVLKLQRVLVGFLLELSNIFIQTLTSFFRNLQLMCSVKNLLSDKPSAISSKALDGVRGGGGGGAAAHTRRQVPGEPSPCLNLQCSFEINQRNTKMRIVQLNYSVLLSFDFRITELSIFFTKILSIRIFAR